jgi:hypothetical protein
MGEVASSEGQRRRGGMRGALVLCQVGSVQEANSIEEISFLLSFFFFF